MADRIQDSLQLSPSPSCPFLFNPPSSLGRIYNFASNQQGGVTRMLMPVFLGDSVPS